ncbi:MAG: transposase [Thermaerobacter sp.]|nr:transposase [Thermaerobacter sp.]
MRSEYQKKQSVEWVLPREFSLEVAELTGALREGLTAVGLKAAMVIAQQMLAEVDAIAGAKGKHQTDRQATRHGHQGGYVVLGGRKVKLQRPRVRTRDGKEVELRNYQGLQQAEILDEAAFERMLYGVACRHYGAVDGGLPEELEAYGDSKSAVSALCPRNRGAAAAVPAPPDRDADAGRVRGRHLPWLSRHPGGAGGGRGGSQARPGHPGGVHRERCGDGRPVEDLAARGLHARQGLLFVIDGSKAIAAAVAQVFGENALVQRCQVHKRRNVVEHLPKREQGWVNLRLSTAWAQSDAVCARQDLVALAKEPEVQWPGAAASLREGLDETLTVQKLGLPAQLRRGLRTTNAIEAANSQFRAAVRRVSRFTKGEQALRWVAVAALRAEPRFYRIAGFRYLPLLAQALDVHASRLDEAAARAS